MPLIMPEGTRVPIGGDAWDLTNDLRKMAESMTTIAVVANSTARAALVTALTAAGRAPSATRPLYVYRGDMVASRLEMTTDGTNWYQFLPDGPRSFAHDTAGGGSLTTSWTEASVPAEVALVAGTYIVHASAKLFISAAAPVTVSAHLFTSAGAPIGAGQEAESSVETAGGTNTRTIEFTRRVVLAAPATVRIRLKTTATGGVQDMGVQHLVITSAGY